MQVEYSKAQAQDRPHMLVFRHALGLDAASLRQATHVRCEHCQARCKKAPVSPRMSCHVLAAVMVMRSWWRTASSTRSSRSHATCITVLIKTHACPPSAAYAHTLDPYVYRSSQYLSLALLAHPANLIQRKARSMDTRQVCTASYHGRDGAEGPASTEFNRTQHGAP